MTDLDLILRVKEKQDSTALTALIDLHTGIYVNVVRKYASYADFTNKVDVREVIEDKAYNIYQFALKYDPSRHMKFGTYVGECTKHMCRDIIYRGHESVEFNEATAPSNDTSVTDAAEKDSSIEEILNEIKGSDSAKFRQIFKLRYCGQKPLSWRLIAAKMGMSHEGCRKLYEKHIGAVREHMKA